MAVIDPRSTLRTGLVCLSLAMLNGSVEGGKYNRDIDIGQKPAAWSDLPGVDGKRHSLADLSKQAVVIVAFTCNSCPYAVDYEARLTALAKTYADNSNVALVAINVNKVEEDRLPAMIERAKQRKFTFPYLYDESQKIAREFGATTTPEFFVLNKQREVVYMGALDDNTDTTKVTKRYVSLAVEATLAGETPAVAETVPIGCRIRFERTRRRRAKKAAN